MPNFDVLGNLVRDLHQEFVRMYYLILPVFFMLAIALNWFRSGGQPDFIDTLRRAIVATLLLVAFQDISQGILFIADGIAERIDNMSGLDAVMKMAKQKVDSYPSSPLTSILMFNDLIVSIFAFASFLFLYIARYLTIAMYYFFWIFLSVTSPLLLLFHMFPGTSQITANLFRGMCEVASWKIVWAILSAMLASLSFGDYYQVDGNYLTMIVMNLMIAIAMLMTPLLVRSLVGSGLQAMSTALGAATVGAFTAVPAKGITVFRAGTAIKGRAAGRIQKFRIPTTRRSNGE
jgi:hypothetical protein